jgi:hypothetical protein
MSNLIPVVRPDANGKLVTRHVKAIQAPAAASALVVPRVQNQGLIAASGATIEAAKGRRALLGSVTTAFTQREVPFQRHTRSELAELVREIPDSTAELFHTVNVDIDDNMEKVFLSRLVLKTLDCGTGDIDIESAIHYFHKSNTFARDSIDEYFEVGAKKLAAYPIGNLISAVKSYNLEGFSFDPDLPIGKQDQRTMQQCEAIKVLHYIAEKAEHWEPNPTKPFAENGTLLDTRFAQMVVDRPEIAEDVADVIYERETLDYDLISNIFGSAAPAVREGAL